MQEQPEIPQEKRKGSYEGFEDLPFDALKELYDKTAELTPKTFRQTEDGFENALGEKIIIVERGGAFMLSSQTDRKFHNLLNSLRGKATQDKGEALRLIREELGKAGNRIIE